MHLEHKFEVLKALLKAGGATMTEGVKGLVRVINPCGRDPSDTREREKELGRAVQAIRQWLTVLR